MYPFVMSHFLDEGPCAIHSCADHDLHDAADNGAIGEHIIIVTAPLRRGERPMHRGCISLAWVQPTELEARVAAYRIW